MAYDQSSTNDGAQRIKPVVRPAYSHMPYLVEVNDTTITTRENALLCAFEVRGLDGMTSAEADLTHLRSDFARVLDSIDERFTIYVHRLLRPANLYLKPMADTGFAGDIDAAWHSDLQQRDLRDFMVVVSVVRSEQSALPVPLFRKRAARVFKERTSEALNDLQQIGSILQNALPVTLTPLRVSDGALIGFLSSINTGQFTPEQRGTGTLIAEDVCKSDMSFERGLIDINDGAQCAAVLWVKKYPVTTTPGFLDDLDVRDGIVITHSYTPASSDKIVERVKRRLNQMQAAEDLASTIAEQLMQAADGVESGQLGFGEHQMSVTLFAPTSADLDIKVSEFRGAAQQAGVHLVREAMGCETTFFATHPGNMDYRCRAMIVSSITFADCAALHTVDLGTRSEDLPWRTPVTVFETAAGTAHRFSFHPTGDPQKEPTNVHSLVLGPSSGGKTTTTLFLAAQVLRAGGRVLVLDKDRAMEMPITALGGQYAGITAGQPTGLAPLLTERGPRGEAWLMAWMSSLLEATGKQLTPRQSEALKSAVRQNATAPQDLRSFTHFKDLIGDVGDDRDLALRIAEWGPGGRYDWVFGEADKPVVDFAQNDVTGVDLTEVLKLGTERTAILGYLFRAIELLMEDRRPTLLVVDEAWQVLNDEYFAKEMSEWLVTARKKNVVVLMLTQFPSQIRASKSRTILEGLPNQLLFANRKAEPSDYDGFALSDSEMGFVLNGAGVNSRMALWRGAQSSTILNVNLSGLDDLLTVLGGGEAGLRRFGTDYASHPQFWRTS